jgi:hypothetical protein
MKKTFGIVMVVTITLLALFLAPREAGAEQGKKTQHQENAPITCPAGTASASLDAFLKSMESCTVSRKHRWMVWKPRRVPAVKTRKVNKEPVAASALFSVHQRQSVVQ